jgi:NAD(P)-dependent dehydrogenase (short-subunit alcohol dehydrogenase family)
MILSLDALAAEPAAADSKPAQKAVLVTGASSGIGRLVAEKLAAEGFFVYGGARKAEDIAALSAIDNIEGIRLDVTRQAEIDAAVALIGERGRGLYGLVNNAGVAVIAPLIEATDADMQFQMDANLFGPWRVTRAFAPMIIESKGRITTTGSISGSGTGPLYGPYSMSKFAMEAFTDALAMEMQRFGVTVSIVDPGNYQSDISKSLRARRDALGQTVDDSRYAEDFARFLSAPEDRSNYEEPTVVADAFLHAFTSEQPRRRYLVVPNASAADWTLKHLLSRVVQLNGDQPYSRDRGGLIQLLDEVIAKPTN